MGAAERVHVDADAHEGAVWSVAALPDNSGFVSGSADKTVKFWQVGAELHLLLAVVPVQQCVGAMSVVHTHAAHAPFLPQCAQWSVTVSTGGNERGGGRRTVRLAHVRTLRMADDVLCCKVSPDGKLLAVALLDATVKVRWSCPCCSAAMQSTELAVFGLVACSLEHVQPCCS